MDLFIKFQNRFDTDNTKFPSFNINFKNIFDDEMLEYITNHLVSSSKVENLILTKIVKLDFMRKHIGYFHLSDNDYESKVVPFLILELKKEIENTNLLLEKDYELPSLPDYFFEFHNSSIGESNHPFNIFSAIHDYYVELQDVKEYLSQTTINQKISMVTLLKGYSAYCDLKFEKEHKHYPNFPEVIDFIEDYIGESGEYLDFVNDKIETVLKNNSEIIKFVDVSGYGDFLIAEGSEVCEINGHYFEIN